MEKEISVIFVAPKRHAKIMKIGNNLDTLQELVDGYIEVYRPYDDDVVIICNEEGKLKRMDLNRAIMNDKNEVMDIIQGNFIICYAPGEDFESLPPDLESQYFKKFKLPEIFRMTMNGIIPIKKNRV